MELTPRLEKYVGTSGATVLDDTKLERFRGDTYPILVTISINGSTDLTSATTNMGFRNSNGNLYSCSGTITNEQMGIVEFVPPQEVRDNTGSYKYDIQVTTQSGEIITVIAGDLEIIDDVYK